MGLKEFIKEAKKSTYASGYNAEKINLTDGGNKICNSKR